jgi:hydroxypyruvate reductase
VLLGNATILQNAERIARELGYDVDVDSSCDDWDYEDAAKYLLAKLATMRGAGRKVCLLSGGEVTVRLPREPGIGGRNLQFCLFCVVQDLMDGTTVLSAGTDGIDGSSGGAGAVVDGTTDLRGEEMGLRMDEYLRRFDAYRYLEPLGDAIVTGATGNNLRDVRILLWEDAGR